jgi:hypothetical protein
VRRAAFGVAVLAALGCGGLVATAGGLGRVREALPNVDVEFVAPIFAAGAAESGLVLGCAEPIAAWANSDPSQRQTVLASSLLSANPMCPRACGGGTTQVEALATLEGRERSRAAISACDAEGPDPVFGGPLAPLRSGMAALEYLVFRDLLGRAAGADPLWAEQFGGIAVSLVLSGRPELTPSDLVAIDGSFTPPPGQFQALADALRACPSPHLQHRVVVAPGGGVVAVGGPDDCVRGVLRGLTFDTAPGWAWFDVTWTVPPPTQ